MARAVSLDTPVEAGNVYYDTEILPVATDHLSFHPDLNSDAFSEHSRLAISDVVTARTIERAARELRDSDIPVAFPTETVYGLGADAMRSVAVRNIFATKGRPADNPLIVHVHSLSQLDALLKPWSSSSDSNGGSGPDNQSAIPLLYRPLIKRFWPGPLTIILKNPPGSLLTQEVTAGLSTFGARMPSHPIALAILKASDRPLAAPSANASTKPSPTTAAHVFEDLRGRIKTIVDGGSCDYGIESTVVDGLSDPPIILRPGGISIEMLRSVEGWENVIIGYEDGLERQQKRPRAPGMKYRHYSPKARVVLYEAGSAVPTLNQLENEIGTAKAVGIVRTVRWPRALNAVSTPTKPAHDQLNTSHTAVKEDTQGVERVSACQYEVRGSSGQRFLIWDVALGLTADAIAQGLFAALRLLDFKKCDVIFVEGIENDSGGSAAAVMNRLRKAAEVRV